MRRRSRGRVPMAGLVFALAFVLWLGLVLTAGFGHSSWAAESSAPPAAPAAPETLATSAYSAASLYNLANSYARAGKPGLAVLNYERARLLAPGDPDIEANERHVRESLRLPPDSPTAFQRAVTQLNPTLVAWIGVLGVILIGTALIAGRVSERRRGLRRTALLLGVTAVGLTVCNALVLWPTLHEGVIVTNSAPVLVSPVPMGEPLLVLPEAETVGMTAEHEDYVLIRTRAGRTGWVSRANLVSVVPR